MNLTRIIASGIVPDFIFRIGIRRQLRKHINSAKKPPSVIYDRLNHFINDINNQPIAIDETDANEQHYELPTSFFITVLGERLKYSSALFEREKRYLKPENYLDLAEEKMLSLTTGRAEISNGQDILELGCGWGSLSLFIAEKFPGSRITSISNSRTQKKFIEEQAEKRNIKNLRVITQNVEDLNMPEDSFDRIVSVEMFEHLRNYSAFMKKLYPVLRSSGKMFIHIFSFRYTPYHFNKDDPEDWMAKHFFAGGTMPSHDLLPFCCGPFHIDKTWVIPGVHYGNTLRAWLRKMDNNKRSLFPVFRQVYNEKADDWWNNWRAFFIICEELFNYNRGNDWSISHYLFNKDTSSQKKQ
jgi:cyclopropane-fatty-acyl-phospholipid synthase